MPRLLSLSAVLSLAGLALGDPPSVADLVKQLGDDKFARREAAQKEMLRRGDAIVPELDRLTKVSDAETAERIRKVLSVLVGYRDDIRRLLAEVKEGQNPGPVGLEQLTDTAPRIPGELRRVIARHQPGAGNFLLTLLADPKHELRRPALLAFVNTWNLATPDQLDAYIRQSVSLTSAHRSKFPAKVAAVIVVEAWARDGPAAWPRLPQPAMVHLRVARHLDGKPYDSPTAVEHPSGPVGRYRVGELTEGTHAIHAVIEYEFTHRGEKRTGEIRSKVSHFEVVPADTPDDLIAPDDDRLAAHVKAGLNIDETGFRGHGWVAHARWAEKGGGIVGLHGPVWEVKRPLDVDLCFDVEIEDVRTGKVCPAGTFVLRRGQTGYEQFLPADPRSFAAGRQGYVPVRVFLKPSRAAALSDPKVTRYYPRPIRTSELDMKVITGLREDF
jgi:hypothetical protein